MSDLVAALEGAMTTKIKSMMVPSTGGVEPVFPKTAKRKTINMRNLKSQNSRASRTKKSESESGSRDSLEQFYEDMTNGQFQDELMSESNLAKITFSLFDKKMKDADVQAEVAGALSFHLSQKFNVEYDYEDIKRILSYVDKGLFMNFRDGKLTLAQLKARVAERRGFAKYKVLDDVYHDLSLEERRKILAKPNMAIFLFGKNPKPEDFSRPLAPWESNARCLRSIKYKHKKGSRPAKNRGSSAAAHTRSTQKAQLLENQNATRTMSPLEGADQNGKFTDTSLIMQKQRQSSAGANPLIDEKALKSKKNRLLKESELRKRQITVHNLKRKLAKQIVDKTLKLEEFKQMSCDDLFDHAADLDRLRAEHQERKMTMFNGLSEMEKQRLLDKIWQQRANQQVQSTVQQYSSNFELDQNLSEEQKDILRLKMKVNDDPYQYFQERQNQIHKAFDLMGTYKTVHGIEQQIKEAQNYVKYANHFYTSMHDKKSPTKAEYDYIRRLVDDGQPVVLTKKIRKALALKDEMEGLQQAMNQDMKEAGVKKAEISQLMHYEVDSSDEDSAERRLKSVLSQQQQAKNQVRLTKKEKAEKAYRAERYRQKLLKPKHRVNESVWDQHQRMAKTKPVSRLGRLRSASSTFSLSHPAQQAALKRVNTSAMIHKEIPAEPSSGQLLESAETKTSLNRNMSTGKQKTVIEVRKLPKYYSSKLITRNQSNTRLKDGEFMDVDSRNGDINMHHGSSSHPEGDMPARATTLKGQDYVELGSAERPDSRTQGPLSDASPSVSSQKRISLLNNNMRHEKSALLMTQKQTKSAFQLRTLKKFHQTARSVTNTMYPTRPQSSGDMLNEPSQILEEEEPSINHQMEFAGFVPPELEDNMSKSMIDFVYTYGIAVQKASQGSQEASPFKFDTTKSTALMATQTATRLLSQTKFGSLASKNALRPLKTQEGARMDTEESGLIKTNMFIDVTDSQDDFESVKKRSSSALMKIASVRQNVSSARLRQTRHSQVGRQKRAVTATRGKRSLITRLDRQDLNFNSQQELAEETMKEKRLLLFKQRLDQNYLRSGQPKTAELVHAEMQNQQKAKQVAADIVAQTEKNQSSDYNTKAIATRLRSIAQKRIQTAAQSRGQEMAPRFARNAHIAGAISRNIDPAIYASSPLGNTGTASSRQLDRLNSQITEMTLNDKPSHLKATVWANPNLVTLKASTENSVQNLLQTQVARNSLGPSQPPNQLASEFILSNQSTSHKKDLSRVRSGMHPVPMPLVKVSDQRRQESLSPFEDIPITSSKKNRDSSRSTAAHHRIFQQHHYVQNTDKQASGYNLAQKPSAQTLLA